MFRNIHSRLIALTVIALLGIAVVSSPSPATADGPGKPSALPTPAVLHEERFVAADGFTSSITMIPRDAPNHEELLEQALGVQRGARSSRGGNNVVASAIGDMFIARAYCNCTYGQIGYALWESAYGWGTTTWMYYISGGGTQTLTTPVFCGQNAGCTFISRGNFDRNPIVAPQVMEVEFTSPVAVLAAWCG